MNKGKSINREILEWALTLFIALFIAILLKSTAFAMVRVQGTSMENTLLSGQKLFENKLAYDFSTPKKGDIVILNRQKDDNGAISDIKCELKDTYNNIIGYQDENILIKRVIGIPGDKIDIKDGHVYVNGEKLNEYYVKGKTYPNDMKFPIIVPNNKVFVLGDNREVSLDSRIIGFIGYNQIDGKVFYRIWPFDKVGSLYK